MKTLLLDIETSANLVYSFGLFNQNININQIVESGQTICFAAKWLGKKKLYFKSLNDPDMLETIHQLMSESDAIVTYNGKSFDIPILNKEFLLADMEPPAPSHQIDLYRTIKRHFKFTSHKLQYVSKALGIGTKESHSGFSTWVGCMNGDKKSWKEMKKYNLQDVILLESLYHKLLPWDDQHPNINLYTDDEAGCPNCASTDMQKRGFSYTKLRKYQRYQCNSCKKYCRSSRSVEGTNIQAERQS